MGGGALADARAREKPLLALPRELVSFIAEVATEPFDGNRAATYAWSKFAPH